jgi:hypothetical protein
MHSLYDSAVTVSLKVTIGSLLTIGHLAKSSSKSFRQISTCNSPHPATIFYPFSSVVHTTNGSDLDNFLRPSISFGKSTAFFG